MNLNYLYGTEYNMACNSIKKNFHLRSSGRVYSQPE